MSIHRFANLIQSLCICCLTGTGLLSLGCDSGAKLGQVESPEPAKTASQNAGTNESPAMPVPVDPRFKQSFAEATRSEPPADFQRPPDLTLTRKSTGKLYSDLVAMWPTIDLVSSDGRLIPYSATLETDVGNIEIALRADLAPNHVRNFIGLARLGYYDGLVFERTVHAKSADQPGQEVEVLEGGCPLGTGDIGVGSLGYWLKPEYSQETHDIGTIGAPRGADADTACCRFYVTLSKATFLDGHFTVFGKVVGGADVAKRIFALPVRNDAEYPEGDRPEKPVVIRRVTINTGSEGQATEVSSQ
jgi:cyclophilin family peptidyl-prolyl cis-trans isomerase